MTMKGYNKRNFILKVIKIQEITLEHTSRGVTQAWIYREIIAPNYFISRTTYYKYLAFNAKSELKKLNSEQHG